MADWLVQIANEMDLLESRPPKGNGHGSTSIEQTLPALVAVAESMYRNRRLREEIFDSDLFGEPAWNMLLDLYVNHVRGQRISVTSLCYASRRPITTALRWIVQLEERSLVSRDGSSSDNRVRFVDLTKRGIQLMNRYMCQLVNTLPPSLPMQLAAARELHPTGK